MSTKQHFLNELRKNLRKYPSGKVNDYIEYFDELIAERIANGETESVVLQKIGAPEVVAAGFKQDAALSRAVKKPTASNGFKALLAVLGVLSLPFLIPVVAVVISLLLVCVVLFVGLLVAFVGSALFAAFGAINMAYIVFTEGAPIYLLFLCVGAALIIISLMFELTRNLFRLGRWMIRFLIHKLSARHRSKKQQAVSLEE